MINKFKDKYTINNLINYNNKEINNYLKHINNLICNDEKMIFSRKYYIFTYGLSKNEIFVTLFSKPLF